MNLRAWRRNLLFYIAGAIACAAIGVFGFAVRDAHEAAMESACVGRMCVLAHHIGISYAARHTFPVVHTDAADDSRGNRLDSVIGLTPEEWTCGSGRSSYHAVTGEGTIFDGTVAATANDVADGCANTLLLIELSTEERARVESRDVGIGDLDALVGHDKELSATSIHAAGRGIIFADCMIYRLVKPVFPDLLKALATKSGGEPITRQQLIAQGYLSEPHWHPMIPRLASPSVEQPNSN